ncbi:MAG: lipoate-protein ligase B [Rhodospirillaceae bacterium]|nr:lipoate-protein ligase B [Rhodospirillaceae bacterium]
MAADTQDLETPPFPADTADTLEWRISDAPVPYEEAVAVMEDRAAAIRAGTAPEMVWLLEHPPLYTAGTSADPSELTDPDRFPVHKTGRGGRYTYHGPGQRIGYVMLDLKKRGEDVRAFVCDLENWIIQTLAEFNITGERRDGRVGIWVARGAPGSKLYREDKIAAIGVRVRKWVTFHGVSLNIEPDLGHFDGIVPCGINEHGVTSLVDLGVTASTPEVDVVLRQKFAEVFGRG